MRYFTTFALATALSSGSAQGSNWNTWPICDFSGGRRLREESNTDTLEAKQLHAKQIDASFPDYNAEARQIITYNLTDGNLVLNEKSVFYADDLETDEVIHVIMIWGDQQAGKSTTATFLQNLMRGEDEPFQFKPSLLGVTDDHTQGVWASPVFEYLSRKYVVVDGQALFVHNANAGMDQDWSYKTVALFSELASVFVYMSSNNLGFDKRDFDAVGLAMRSTRDHLVQNARRKADGEADKSFPVNDEAGLSSVNHAGLIMARQERTTANFLKPDEFAYDRTSGFQDAVEQFEDMDETNRIALSENFKLVPHPEEANAQTVPFHQVEIAEMDGSLGTPAEFRAGIHEALGTTFYDTSVTSAQRLMEMDDLSASRCKWGTSPPSAATVPSFKLSMQHMVDLIHQHAPTRKVARARGDALPLTGRRFKEVMRNGIVEMNAIGPLPQASLWRRVVEDRCEAELFDHIDFTVGARTGNIVVNGTVTPSTGSLRQLEEILDMYFDAQEGFNLADLDARWEEEHSKIYRNANLSAAVSDFFTGRPLMSAVRGRCEMEGLRRRDLLQATFEALENRQSSMYQSHRRLEAEKRANQLAAEVRGLQRELVLQKYKYYLIIGAIVGSILCLVFSRMFSQFSSVCSFCLICTGNTGDTSQSLIVVKDHGVTGAHYNQTGAPPRGAAGMAASVPLGTSSAAQGPPKLMQARASTTIEPQDLETQGLSAQARLDMLNQKLNDLENHGSRKW